MILLLTCNLGIAEEITIVGTGSGMSLLKSLGEAFTAKNPDVRIIVPDSIGSGGGIKAVGNDENVLGRVGRMIKEKEKSLGLTYLPIFKMPIVFFVNKKVGIKDLSTEQICGMYSGKIEKWSDVGGPTGNKIRLIRREDGDSSLQVLQDSFPGFKAITISEKSKTTYKDPETLEAAQNIDDTIAFGTNIEAKQYNVDIISINGKKASDEDYPYLGELALVFKEKNKTGNIQKFIEFCTSTDAHEVIKKGGGLPLK